MTAAPPEGLLLIDKPSGITSHDAVARVRRALGTKKVGHAGTLDPMATGLLVIGVGRATRLLRFLGELPKTYEGTFLLGVETDTLDAEGTEVRRTSTEGVTLRAVADAAAALLGESLQRPPAYSAVKVGGQKLYDAAREGQDLQAEPREVRVDRFDVTAGAIGLPEVDFVVVCSGGTYVRVLAADVGTAIGCGAHLIRLRRTAIGLLTVADATPPEDPGALLPVENAVRHLPRIELDPEEAVAAGHGRILGPAGIEGPYGAYAPDGRLVGIYRDDLTKAIPEMILAPAAEPSDAADLSGPTDVR
ncbi:MAG: tRNA pseudouridine55 synthase [Actinomycetota bacterium]|nr:tRNA pseudouridine55 synthase [Actinomycetota bacterium]